MVRREPQHLTTLKRALGRRLAHRCDERGVTQQQLGNRTGYSRSSISHIIAGRQTPDRRDFWVVVDSYLDSGGNLVAAYDEYAEVKHHHYEVEIAALITPGPSPGHDVPLMSLYEGSDDPGPPSGGDPTKRRQLLKTIGVGATSPIAQQIDGLRQLVLNAAHGSALLHSVVDTPGIDPHTLDEARHDLYRLATDYVVTSSLPRILRELVILRDRLYMLLDRHGQRPADARELHLLLGATCVLLASISHDLAEPRAAVIQTRTALALAERAGHRSLLTWVYCTRAMIDSWWGKPEDVLHHAHQSQTVGARHGVAAVRLAGLQARAFAQLGNSGQAVHLLQTANDQRDTLEVADTLHELGEVFTFPRARQHYYNAATHLHLGNWAAAGREANTVISLYGQPTTPQWPVTLTLARIYLAQSRLHESGPEGAWDALTPVFDIPAEARIPQTTQALGKLHHQLRAKPFARLPAARHLDQAIHTLTSTTRRQGSR